MRSLSEWQEEWMAMFELHPANETPAMLEEWKIEKKHFLKLYNNRNVSVTVVEMCGPTFGLHIGVHANWLKNQVIDVTDPGNLLYLTNLTHHDDQIFSLETELIGYEILMSLPPEKQSSFWMKYHRRFQDKDGEYHFFELHFKVHKFDENGIPWLMMIETKRLPRKYQSDKKHHCEFSHKLKQQTKQKEPVLKKLSRRELQVLELVHEGYTTKEIAAYLNISTESVKTYRKRILAKRGIHKTHLA